MKILNIHKRTIDSPKEEVAALLSTLASKNDKIWPIEHWPAMKLDKGLSLNSKGGHGPIRYQIVDLDPESHIEFLFSRPTGFHGTHKLQIQSIDNHNTLLKHTIEMNTCGMGTVLWISAIRWLHDALIEDAFDKIENQLTGSNYQPQWNIWVNLLRYLLSPSASR